MRSIFEVHLVSRDGLSRVYDCGFDRERAFSVMNELKYNKDTAQILIFDKVCRKVVVDWHIPAKKLKKLGLHLVQYNEKEGKWLNRN